MRQRGGVGVERSTRDKKKVLLQIDKGQREEKKVWWEMEGRCRQPK